MRTCTVSLGPPSVGRLSKKCGLPEVLIYTVSAFNALSSFGVTGMGEGVMGTSVEEFENVPIPIFVLRGTCASSETLVCLQVTLKVLGTLRQLV